MSGYQLRAAIAEHLGHFWAESFGQIYPSLARLERDGLVRRVGTGRTSGSTFELTPAGRAALADGLATPPESVPPRNGVLLRLFFGDVLGVDGCRALLTDVAEQSRSALEQYARIRAGIEAEDGPERDSPGRPYRLMTLSAGEHSARAALAWAQECLAALSPARPPAAPPR